MLALIIAAVRRRRMQAALLLVLGALAAAGAAAAPGYVAAWNERLAAAAVEQATPEQKLVRSADAASVGPDGGAVVAASLRRMEAAIALPGYRRIHDVRVQGYVGAEPMTLAARDNVCAEVAVEGACAPGPDSIVIAADLASRLEVRPGATVDFISSGVREPVRLTVAGIYTPRDPAAVYWLPIRDRTPVAYTGLGSVVDPRFGQTPLTITFDQVLTPDAFRRTGPQQLALAFEVGNAALAASSVRSQSQLRALADQIFHDQQFVLTGVAVGACHLLLLSWLALYLAIRHTAHSRRPDVALVKMRGGTRRDLWLLVTGQSVLPILAGGVLGLVLGGVGARLLAGPVEEETIRRQVLSATVLTAAAAVLGAVVAALIAEQRMVAEPVADLARDVPGRRRVWAGRVVDAVVVLVALVAAHEVAGGSIGARGVGLVAPILVALAVGVALARAVPLVAAAAAVPSLRSGRLTLGLATVHIARRGTLSGVLAMSVLAIAVLGGAAVAWDTSARARADRAAAEVGADRVLQVDVASRGQLVAAVRGADPSGRYAMAAFETGGPQPVLAVDATRFAAVAAPYRGGGWADLAPRLHPDPPAAPVRVSGAAITLDATWTSAGPSTVVRAFADLLAADGTPLRALLGPLEDGRHTYQAATPPCASGCRLVNLGLRSDLQSRPPSAGSRLVAHAVGQRQPDAAVLGPVELTDRTQWRSSVLPDAQLARLDRDADGLSLTVGPRTVPEGFPYLETAAYRLDAPTPLPVVLAGPLAPQATIGDDRVGAFTYQLPVSVVATTTAVPRLGANGVLIDLEYADRVVGDGRASGTGEVWLTADAPSSIVDSLAASGVRVVRSDTRAQRLALLDAQWPTIVLRFLLLAAVAGAVLALVAFAVVTAVERSGRARELGALRHQGLAERVVRRVGVGSYVGLSLAATAVAIVTAVALRPLLGQVFPTFGDGWSVLAPPDWRAVALLAPAAAVAVVQVVVALLTGAQLVRAVRRQARAAAPRGPRRVRQTVGGAVG